MSDLISRQVAIDSLTEIIMNLKNVYGDMGSAVNGARECIKSLPSVEPEQKKGEWKPDESGNAYWICSVCGFASEAFGANILYYFCPSCGAKMRMRGE